MERLKPKGQCGADAWQNLLIAINRKVDRVMIRREDFDNIIACHEARFGGRSGLIVFDSTRTTVVVDRSALSQFVSDHGKLHKRVLQRG